MKKIKQLKWLTFLLATCTVFYSCSDKLEENDGQVAADDLDFTLLRHFKAGQASPGAPPLTNLVSKNTV